MADPPLLPMLWIGVSLALTLMSAQLAFAWVDPAGAFGRPQKLHSLLGAAVSLGTGIWAAQGVATLDPPGAAEAGYPGWSQALIWLAAVLVGIAAFAWADVRRAWLAPWITAAIGLGCAIVALQALGALAAGWQPGKEWRMLPLMLAAVFSVAGCLAAFRLVREVRGRSLRGALWVRLAASGVLGGTIVLSQQCVRAAGHLPIASVSVYAGEWSAWQLAAYGSLGAAVVLMALQGLLQLLTRAQLRRALVRRDQATRALNDPLTGLPNRPLFEGTLAQAVQQADAGRRRLALLLINLDDFKPINEAFGHHGGDRLLREVAARLRGLAPPHMTARLAGDEFLVLLTDDPLAEAVSARAAELLAAVSRPFQVDGREISISCSIGVAMYPEHGAASTLVAHAEAAMRTAKSAGGASHAFFEARMINGSRDQAELLRDLRQALARGQLELYYQPKIDAPTGEITGAEALVRWNHPQRGMVSPVVFIPIAERYGLIGSLGQWVIEESCRQVRAWRDTGLRMRVAINLSVQQLRQPDLAERIAAALALHQINPELITCEITESSAMDDTEVTMRVLGELAKVGVHISIDDFGTGHSSLAYLRKLPAQELKIDRSFVMDLETSEDARKVASAVVNLAKALDLKVVAEGVETEGQNRILREFGCDQLQGFLFAKPMSAKALALWAMDDVGPRTMSFRDSLFKATLSAEVI